MKNLSFYRNKSIMCFMILNDRILRALGCLLKERDKSYQLFTAKIFYKIIKVRIVK